MKVIVVLEVEVDPEKWNLEFNEDELPSEIRVAVKMMAVDAVASEMQHIDGVKVNLRKDK